MSIENQAERTKAMTEPKRLTPEELAEALQRSRQWMHDGFRHHLTSIEAHIAALEAELAAKETSRHLTTSASHHCPSCGGWHEYVTVCPNNGREIDWERGAKHGS